MTRHERLVLVHDCRWFLFIVVGKGMREGLRLWQKHVMEAIHRVDQEVECPIGTGGYKLLRLTSNDQALPFRPHLLKFPESSPTPTALSAGDHLFQTVYGEQ